MTLSEYVRPSNYRNRSGFFLAQTNRYRSTIITRHCGLKISSKGRKMFGNKKVINYHRIFHIVAWRARVEDQEAEEDHQGGRDPRGEEEDREADQGEKGKRVENYTQKDGCIKRKPIKK